MSLHLFFFFFGVSANAFDDVKIATIAGSTGPVQTHLKHLPSKMAFKKNRPSNLMSHVIF